MLDLRALVSVSVFSCIRALIGTTHLAGQPAYHVHVKLP
jgi:hypothetical protein